jgi:hypothetical protein
MVHHCVHPGPSGRMAVRSVVVWQKKVDEVKPHLDRGGLEAGKLVVLLEGFKGLGFKSS